MRNDGHHMVRRLNESIVQRLDQVPIDVRRRAAIVGLMAIAAVYLVGALRLDVLVDGRVGSGLFPLAAAAVVIGSGAIALVAGGRTHENSAAAPELAIEDDDEADDDAFSMDSWKVLVAVVLIVVYVLTMPVAGYLVTTTVFTWLLLATIGQRSGIQQILAAVVLGGASYWLFENVLGVPLPGGLI